MINGRVNEKLYFARLSLNAAENADRAMQSALLEAAVFHLVGAYRCYLHEVTATPSTTFSDAIEIAPTMTQPSAAFEELLILERQSSWLSQLLAAYNEVITPMPKLTKPVDDLALVDISAQPDNIKCHDWLRQLQQLIERQREHAQEW